MLLILTFCGVSLEGCSKKHEARLGWSYGSLIFGDAAIQLSEYDGYTALVNNDDYTIEYNSCTGPTDCPHKVIDVARDIMTKYNQSYYFTAFFESMCEMYYPYAEKQETWNEGLFSVKGEEAYPVATMVSTMEPVLKNLPMDGSVESITLNDVVKLNVTAGGFKVSEQAVSIPGYLKAGTDDGSITFDSTMTVGNATIACASSSKYNYYRWGDVIIQIAQGLDVLDYVTFIGAE